MDTPPDGLTAPASPASTYRLQLQAGFGFEAAAAIAPYLAGLGVSHAYCSPYLQAARGSSHGYDVVNHWQVNDELGGADGHALFSRTLRGLGLGQVLDVVPNHMSIADRRNTWWWDVLKKGPASRYAHFFDVDWDPPEARNRNKILMPILGDHYGRVLDAGELRLERDGDEVVVRYHEQVLPIDPNSYAGEDPGRLIAAANADRELLHELLERQNYRLAWWRAGRSELDYRRFFDIDTLAAIRVEDEDVFLATNGMVLRWLAAGVVAGLRIDHPDGLRDPEQYLRRLQEAAPRTWVVVEKILAADEELPASWPVAGTTGYEFLNLLGGLFVDPAGEAPMTRFYADFTGETRPFQEVAYEAQRFAVTELLASELNLLTARLLKICEANRRYRDFTRSEVRQVLIETMAALPVYRTYVRPGRPLREEDQARIEGAVEAAKKRRPDLDAHLFDFLADILLDRQRGEDEAQLLGRFQQTTGAVMAKGLEDTAFYRYNRLASLNEVGGDPARFGTRLDDFHCDLEGRAQRWPAAMLGTSTHDTKRSEDVRARLSLLSELPVEWESAVRRWSAHNERHRADEWPDRNTEYLYYQTLVGAHPLSLDRALAYMEKAAREAKLRTSWTSPDQAFEAALRGFVTATLSDAGFCADLDRFVRPLLEPGWVNSLAQKLIALTAPGVPDLYQGSELWDLSLVDPDNRRPVDFELRRRLLAEVPGLTAEAAWARRAEGLPKLLVVARALGLRRRRPEIFREGAAYERLTVTGSRAEHLVAFARGAGAVTLAPRLLIGLAGDWADTTVRLPAGEWRCELTGRSTAGGEQPVGALLSDFPVSLLATGTT
ncbi:MAG: malto-oligosyltrehalose synthase [Chloroflexi bacterium]|nr:MAG: malto-oligosyltrehalose synthase [Chloroflexota bacterium]